ncbi:MAG: hypothetical protein NT124_00150 [Candidatus Dependentiae bacterium]|nr:hypothetical protein [Candidatus Dependentiae bacterium]
MNYSIKKILFSMLVTQHVVFIFPAAEQVKTIIPRAPTIDVSIAANWLSQDKRLNFYKMEKRKKLLDLATKGASVAYALTLLNDLKDARSPGLVCHLQGHYNHNTKKFVGGHLGHQCGCGAFHTQALIDTSRKSCDVVVTPRAHHNEGMWCYDSIKPILCNFFQSKAEKQAIKDFLKPHIEKYTQDCFKDATLNIPGFLGSLSSFADRCKDNQPWISGFIQIPFDHNQQAELSGFINRAHHWHSATCAFEVKDDDRYYKALSLKAISDKSARIKLSEKKLKEQQDLFLQTVNEKRNAINQLLGENQPPLAGLEEAIQYVDESLATIAQQIDQEGRPFRPLSPFESDFDESEEVEEDEEQTSNLPLLVEKAQELKCIQQEVKNIQSVDLKANDFFARLSFLYDQLINLKNKNDFNSTQAKGHLSEAIALKSKELINLRDKVNYYESLNNEYKQLVGKKKTVLDTMGWARVVSHDDLVAKLKADIDEDQIRLISLDSTTKELSAPDSIVSFQEGIIEVIIQNLDTLKEINKVYHSSEPENRDQNQAEEKIKEVLYRLDSFVQEATIWWHKNKHIMAEWQKVKVPGAKGVFPFEYCTEGKVFEDFLDLFMNGIASFGHREEKRSNQSRIIDTIVPLQTGEHMLIRGCVDEDNCLKTLYPLMPLPPQLLRSIESAAAE